MNDWHEAISERNRCCVIFQHILYFATDSKSICDHLTCHSLSLNSTISVFFHFFIEKVLRAGWETKWISLSDAILDDDVCKRWILSGQKTELDNLTVRTRRQEVAAPNQDIVFPSSRYSLENLLLQQGPTVRPAQPWFWFSPAWQLTIEQSFFNQSLIVSVLFFWFLDIHSHCTSSPEPCPRCLCCLQVQKEKLYAELKQVLSQKRSHLRESTCQLAQPEMDTEPTDKQTVSSSQMNTITWGGSIDYISLYRWLISNRRL